MYHVSSNSTASLRLGGVLMAGSLEALPAMNNPHYSKIKLHSPKTAKTIHLGICCLLESFANLHLLGNFRS